ncbi:hypothetical protein FSZ31_08575 [Sphingorhabdus soli]|uniref:SPOR domain-containing protein n=1 Tax=Flavisphingopyxis soli TaxID=2601267 RepID=A0A5C6U983_9SPHN|nr:SPOR domain-containing protein [Sphingorhabdus soli]TXC68990.1 hypothetical protein FSZ31_08575 [Sphingorhabdus soli]
MVSHRHLIALVAAGAALTAVLPAYADVKAGVEAWERGDYAAAVAAWRTDAIKGDADAQFNLAQAYKLGRGVPADLSMAENLYRRAAEQGHVQAQDNYGIMLFTNGKQKDAMPWLEKSAARGEPRAQYIVGTAAFNGDFLPRDPVRGYAMMQRANEAGLEQAAASLANMEPLLTPAQKTQGLAMAQELARTERNARLALVEPAAKPVTKGPVTVKPTTLPPSQPGVTFTPPPMAGDPAPTPAPVIVATPNPVPAPARIVPAPVKVATASPPAATRGKWRIQLGAFSSRANAEALWSKLSKSGAVAGLQADYQSTGRLTRVRTGAYSTRGEAEAACKTFKARGQGCFPVAN